MTERVRQILEAAKQLTPDEQIDVAESLFVSLDDRSKAQANEQLGRELDRRWAEYKSGKMPSLTLDEAEQWIKERRGRE